MRERIYLSFDMNIPRAAKMAQDLLPCDAPAKSFCSQCREEHAALQQCARCHLAKYCSRTCQKKHFALHKHICKRVALLQTNLAATAGNDAGERNSHDDRETELLLGHSIVEMAYRSTDTIERGHELYVSALRHYLECLRLWSDDGPGQVPLELVDTIGLLLVAVGRHEASVSFLSYCYSLPPNKDTQKNCAIDENDFNEGVNVWVYPRCSPYSDMFISSSTENLIPTPTLQSLVTVLLIKLRILGDFGKVGSPSFLGEQRKHAQSILDKIVALDPSVPERILECAHGREGSFLSPHTPEDLWYLLQDCFMLSPGVFDLLYELVHGDVEEGDKEEEIL